MKPIFAKAGLAALLFTLATAAVAAERVYREMDPMEDYPPTVEGDKRFSNTYQYWKDRNKIDPVMAGNPDEYWKMNWKFMDAPFNTAIHGGHFALDRGETLYRGLNKRGGFAACLGASKGNLKGLRTGYPRFRQDLGRVAGLEEVIAHCAAKEGVTLENGSYDNSAVSVYVASFSNGLPIRIDVAKGPMKEAFERGRKLFHTKSGRLNFACSSCHTHNIGHHLRGNMVTTPFGDAVHYPVYRTHFDLESIQIRMMECNLDAQTQPLKPGNPVYTDLEVFLTALSNGYPVQVPSERQ